MTRAHITQIIHLGLATALAGITGLGCAGGDDAKAPADPDAKGNGQEDDNGAQGGPGGGAPNDDGKDDAGAGDDDDEAGGEDDGGDDGGDNDDGDNDDGDNNDGDGDAGGEDDSAGDDDDDDADEADEESAESPSEDDSNDEDCDEESDVVLYISPDDSNSMSSPVQVRQRVLEEGSNSLRDVHIRPWEFMNYYEFPYEPAAAGSLAITAELAEGSDTGDPETERYIMQLAIRSETVADDERAPINVTLVLDTSGSMSGEPMELMRESCKAIAASLRDGDNVSMVEWDTENSIRLENHEVTGPSDPILLDAIDSLAAGGGTNLYSGLATGYALANKVWAADRTNRIVLVSDGGANAGVTDIDLIAQNASINGSDGIYMVGVGVGGGNYNDTLMDEVTDAGKGASVFVNNEREAWKVFSEDFLSTVLVAARDVQVELALPPGFEMVKFSGEGVSTDPDEIPPQHLAPNDAMVFYQEFDTCAPDAVGTDTTFTVTARYKDAVTFEDTEVSETFSFGQLLGTDPHLWPKGAAVLAYAQALRGYKKALGDDDKQAALAPAITATEKALVWLADDIDLLEIREVLTALVPS
ncbi:MAG: VWA domain-containing protein [Nannocystaceae bacterium]